MRRRLILVSAAVTGMVVIAFLVPLFILVGDLARDSAISTAERDAELLARTISVLTVQNTLDEAIEIVGEDRIADLQASVILPDGSVVGLPIPAEEDLSPAEDGSSFIADAEGGIAVFIPVLTTDGSTAVVRVFASDAQLTEGVMRSRATLALLGLGLIAIAAWVADRLGRSMVEPVNELADTAVALGTGDLTARVQPSGPDEIREVGIELNRLADDIGRLIQLERETAADLAHRLRTPLTAAKLSVEGLPEGTQRDRLQSDLDDLERTTNFIITEARRPVRKEEQGGCDLAVVARDRASFWAPLASEQARTVSVSITEGAVPVAIPSGDAEAVIDALIENVLSHTPDSTAFLIGVDSTEADAVLFVEDAGPGFTVGGAVERGASQGDSTGLGLDIVRRTIEGSGGTLSIGESRGLGGAGIVLTVPLAPVA